MNKKRKYIIFISILSIIILSVIGTSYAYWRFSVIQDKVNVGKSKCLSMEINNEANVISLSNIYPISDEEGRKSTPYSFTITNTCDVFASYNINLEMLEGTTMNSDYMAVLVNSESIKRLGEYDKADIVLDSSVESRTIATGTLGAGDSIDYALRLWLDKSVTSVDAMNKVFKSKVVVEYQPSNYNPKDAGYNTLHDAILANEYQTTPEIAIEKIKAKQSSSITDNGDGTYTVTNTAPIIKWMEKVGDTGQTRTVVKIAESAIKTDDATSNLTINDTKMRIYTAKTFNSENGRYTLSNMQYVDPSTLTFGGGTHYYYSTEDISYNTSSKKLHTSSNNGGITVYEITGAITTSTKTSWNGVEYASNTYTLTTNTLTETELESDKSDKGLYAGTDGYGTTYYYRGNVKNNNVLFAGYYWQIVRINGDGSIRIIYNGSKANATGTAQSINAKNYQFNSRYNDPAYVGYMYGDVDADNFDEVHANINDSTIKAVVDSWYKTNIEDKSYSSYISTYVGFCGDRSLSSGDGIQIDKDTGFASYGRYVSNTATFNCINTDRDMYTTAKSDGETRKVDGNQALTYPVGLATYDELVFAGIDGKHINNLSWAYSTNHYWTMSPSFFYSSDVHAQEWIEYSDGYLRNAWVTVNFGVRPVINLKSDVEISGGIGTATDPFVIAE